MSVRNRIGLLNAIIGGVFINVSLQPQNILLGILGIAIFVLGAGLLLWDEK